MLGRAAATKGERTMDRKKLLLSTLATRGILCVSAVAFAQTADANVVAQVQGDISKWAALAGGLGIAIAAFGGALGQGRAAAAALDGIARNPSAADKLFTPMILGLALIESLVIYALIISFVLVFK
jgi:F-type H+-transporting ATPase subunit c